MLASATVTDAIADATRNFEKLFAARDAFGIGQHYCVDAMLLPPGADLVTGRDAIEAFWRSALDTAMSAVKELSLQPVDVHSSGDLAAEVGRYTLKAEGGEPAGDGKYLVVWKREQGTWKILRDTWNANE